MESIRSVQENPFFKHFGIKHNIPVATKTDGQIFRQSSISVEDDDIGEYHPMSGFVHKLKDKFTSLGAKEEYSSFRRSTSLDELLVDSEVVTSKSKVSTESAARTGNDKFSTASKLSYKAKSIEGLNHAHQKPQQFNQRTSPQHTARNLNKDKQLSGTRFHGDLELARDDIIIIEKTPSSPVKSPKVDGSGEHDGSPTHFVISREIISKDELPKPNTVLTVRSIFESASSAASLYSRKQRTDPQLSPLSPSSKPGMSPLHTDVTFSNLDSVTKRGSVPNISPLTSPRPVSDTYVLLPSNSVHTRTSDYSKRLSDSYRSEDLKGPTKSNVTVDSAAEYSSSVVLAKENIPDSSSSSRSATSGDNKSPNFEHDNIPDGSKSSSSHYSFTSSRSTASVRPTFSHKQNTAVKPVALSAPASTTTSYQKSRPVVSVAPYKDKPEDKDDGRPVMIFSKSDISKHGEKSQISNEGTQSSNSSPVIKDQDFEPEQNSISPKEAKKMFEKDNAKATYEPNNRLLSHEKGFSDENNKNSEKIKADTSRIIQTKKETTIEIRRSLTDDADREQATVGDSSSNMETDTSFKSAKPMTPSSTGLTAPKRMAPEPPAQFSAKDNVSVLPAAQINTDNLSKMSSSSQVSNEGLHQEIRKEQTAPSKRLHPKDTAVSNEEPVKKVIKDKNENEQPVKGIPSIIAQRLKQQSSTPSQAADDVTSSSDVSASSQTNNIYSRTVLSSVSSNNSKSSTDNTKQDTLSSEIENEITAVRRKMEANRLKSSGPAQIFDSSQLAKKKKENRKQDPSGRMVPLLDLSGIIVEDVMEYQPQMRKIKPCNIVFIGENTKTSRSLLDKKRTVKINIHFSHNITETFEYPSEEVALESYLHEHPHEKEEILILEEFSAVNGESGESSDDVEIDVYVTPAASDSDSLLKSNTGLAHSGSLQSYRGRFQQEYEFGAILSEEPKPAVALEAEVDPDKQMLRPSEEDDTNTWSTSDSSDLLF